MDTVTINQAFDLPALAEKDTSLKHSGNYWTGPCPFCGGKDRFVIKKTLDGYLWICRKCSDPQKYQDAIAYMAKRENLDLRKEFKEIIKRMGYDLDAIPTHPRPAPPPRPLVTFPPDEWQREALQEIDQASDQFLYSVGAEHIAARQYLVRRGFDLSICSAWLLGSTTLYNRPAILIPHIESTPKTEKVLGVKYRFIDDLARRDKNRRFMARNDSQFALYGLSWVAEEHDTLLIVEGEFNALSLWQVSIEDTSIISFGSQSVGPEQFVLARLLAARYPRVIVWMDEPSKVREVVTALTHPNTERLKSPERRGMKYDANALLQMGWLADFVFNTVGKPCENPDSQICS